MTETRILLAIALIVSVCGTSKAQDKSIYRNPEVKNETLHQKEIKKIIKELEKEWENKTLEWDNKYTAQQGKERYGISAEESKKIVRQRFNSHQLTADNITDAITVAKDSVFYNMLLCEAISWLSEKNEGDKLANLLSCHCPERLYLYLSLEHYLIIVAKDNLKDGTLVLCDAYDSSEDDKVKKTIAACLRRGFAFAGIRSDDDKKFVAECRTWYKANFLNFVPNSEYQGFTNSPTKPDFEKNGLFIKKQNRS